MVLTISSPTSEHHPISDEIIAMDLKPTLQMVEQLVCHFIEEDITQLISDLIPIMYSDSEDGQLHLTDGK